MSKLIFTFFSILFIGALANAQSTTIELESSQSMCITGKGPGQDGAINPYSDGKSTAVVENLGEFAFDVRIQSKGTVIRTIPVAGNSTTYINLEEGEEMYFDSMMPTKVEVKFKEYVHPVDLRNGAVGTPSPKN